MKEIARFILFAALTHVT